MKTVIVANPRAGAGRVGRAWQHYSRSIGASFGPAEVRFTEGPLSATALTRDSIRSGFERVIVVGGDGTLNECVNGLFSADGQTYLSPDVALVLYPAGTGGDFFRSIGLDAGPLQDALEGATYRLVDVGRARFTGADGATVTRHFINVSSFGVSGQIVAAVNRTSKVLGGRVSFALGTVRGLLAHRTRRVRLRVDDAFDREVGVGAVAVANGQYFGGAMQVAPQARLSDGLFDVILMEDIDAAFFLRHARHIYRGRHLGLPGVAMLRGRQVRAEAVDGGEVLIDLDGEQPGRLPVVYDVVPRRVRVYARWERALAS